MARAGVNYQNVLDAIADCQSRGVKPTADSCRAVLGTGSKTTITNYLKRWREEQTFTGGADVTALPQELVDTIKQLWERLCERSQQQVQLAKAEWDRVRNALQTELHQKANDGTRLEKQVIAQHQALNILQATHDDTLQTLRTLEDDKLSLTTTHEAMQLQINDGHTENQRLHDLVKHVQTNLAHYQAESQQLRETQQLALDKERQSFAHQQKITTDNLRALEKSHATLDAKCQQYAHQLGEEKQQRVRAQTDYEKSLQTRDTMRSELAAMIQLQKTTEAKLQQQQDIIVTLEKTNTKAEAAAGHSQEALNHAHEQITQLQSQIDSALTKEQALLQKNAFLEGKLAQ